MCESNESDFIYHYTTIQALKSIIENSTIRFTDYRFLNDPNELKFGKDKVTEYLQKIDLPQERKDSYQEVIDNITKRGIDLCVLDERSPNGQQIRSLFHYYILSLTEKYDDLALWQMYAPNGCCLKIKKQNLINYLKQYIDEYKKKQPIANMLCDIDYFYYNVEYNNHNDRIKYFIDQINKLTKQEEIEKQILCLLLTIKKESFLYENEFRLIIQACDESLSNFELKNVLRIKKVFIDRNNTIVPQIELSIYDICNLIEEIKLSPYIKSDIHKLGVKEFLNYNDGLRIKVSQSDIDIR